MLSSQYFWPAFFVICTIVLYSISIPLLYCYWKEIEADSEMVPKKKKTPRKWRKKLRD